MGAVPREIAARLGSDVTALGSVPTAVALFLRSPDDLETALVSAVQTGGDTDTIASMVGAIAGARVGLTARPLQRQSMAVDRLTAVSQEHLVVLLEDVRRTAGADCAGPPRATRRQGDGCVRRSRGAGLDGSVV